MPRQMSEIKKNCIFYKYHYDVVIGSSAPTIGAKKTKKLSSRVYDTALFSRYRVSVPITSLAPKGNLLKRTPPPRLGVAGGWVVWVPTFTADAPSPGVPKTHPQSGPPNPIWWPTRTTRRRTSPPPRSRWSPSRRTRRSSGTWRRSSAAGCRVFPPRCRAFGGKETDKLVFPSDGCLARL